MSDLLKLQMAFSHAAATLILHAADMGYQVTLGHAQRCRDCVTGKEKSLHKLRLAIDLNLFKEGEFLADTEDHRPLGEWWENAYHQARWGGRFGDGNHYSFEHQGQA